MLRGSNKKKKNSKRTLINKLDKIFSLYIRLRDSKLYGYKYFKCISCGKVKPFEQQDCGHFFSRRHMATRFHEDNCHGECRYCLTPDALVLMDDLSYKPLGEIKKGDELFSFDEYGNPRMYRKGKVVHVSTDIRDVYEVCLKSGEKIKTTLNHKWLAYKDALSKAEWITTKELIPGRSLVCKPYQERRGSLKMYLRPRVTSVKYVGKEEIVVMETDTHTFIANDYAMHNCNRMSADHLYGYQDNLIRKIGKPRFNNLVVLHNTTKNYSEFELQELIKYYTILVNSMK